MNEKEPKLYEELEYLDEDGNEKVPSGVPTHFCLTAQLKEPGDYWDRDACQEVNWHGYTGFEAYDYQGNDLAFEAAWHCARQLRKFWPGYDVKVSFDNFDALDACLDGGSVVIEASGKEYKRAHQ